MARQVAVDVLLGLAVLVVFGSSLGILAMRDAASKLHYVAPAAMLAPLLVGLAVLVWSGWSVNAAETWLALLFLVMTGPYLAHATIRVARIRAQGDWRGPVHDPDRSDGDGR